MAKKKKEETHSLTCPKCNKTVNVLHHDPESDDKPAICEDCYKASTERPEPEKQPEPEKKEIFTPPPVPELPAEIINYRVALRDLLREKESLEAYISSGKAQLKAVEKRVEEINRQFAKGEYTGELFAQQEVKEVTKPGTPPKREDGPEFGEFLTLCGEIFSAYQSAADCFPAEELTEAALYDFVTSNPDSTTSRLLYSKASFKEDENGEYFDIKKLEIDSRSDFQTTYVTALDLGDFAKYLDKWTRIANENDEAKCLDLSKMKPEEIKEPEESNDENE